MEAFEHKGVWWLPESPEYTVSGTLTFTGEERPRLELIGTLRALQEIAEPFHVPIIVGVSSAGKRITLYRCNEVSSTINVPGLQTATFDAAVAFVGRHFLAPEELVFERLSARYDRLSDWARVSGFTFSIEQETENKQIKRFVVAYSFPDPHEVRIGEIAVRFAASFHRSGNALERHDLRQHLFVEAQPSIPTSFEAFLDDIFYHLQNFVTLGLRRPAYPVEITATLPAAAGEPDQPVHPSRIVSVYYAVDRSAAATESLSTSKMLFSFPSIAEEYERCLSLWFEKAPILKPVYDLYFGTMYAPDMYLESKFLSLAQAIETYHRRTAGGVIVSDDDFAPLHRALLATLRESSLADDAREVYTGKLKYLNELPLRRRLREVLRACGKPADMLISDSRSFIARVVDTRNYLTHYDPSLEARATTGAELYYLTEQMRFLLDLCFLKEIGLSEDKRAEIVSKNQDYLQLRAALRRRQNDTPPTG